MMNDLRAEGAGAIAPTTDEGPTVAAVAPQESKRFDSADFLAIGIAEQAALTIEGESYALAYLDRLHSGTQPGELAVILAFLHGEMLAGACRVIEKALEGRHHA